MTDRGAKALTERPYRYEFERFVFLSSTEAKAILGTTGLFIVDATKHEPLVFAGGHLGCLCDDYRPGVSYFDHIGTVE